MLIDFSERGIEREREKDKGREKKKHNTNSWLPPGRAPTGDLSSPRPRRVP